MNREQEINQEKELIADFMRKIKPDEKLILTQATGSLMNNPNRADTLRRRIDSKQIVKELDINSDGSGVILAFEDGKRMPNLRSAFVSSSAMGQQLTISIEARRPDELNYRLRPRSEFVFRIVKK